MSSMPPLFPLTLALYAVAATLYTVAVVQPGLLRAATVGRLLLSLGFISQAVDIGWLCLHGHSPPSEAREAIYFASWLMVGGTLLATLRAAMPVLGLIVLPVAMVLDLVARLLPQRAEPPLSVVPALRSAHIFLATLGIAIFALAAGAGVIYVLTERQLKGHHLGALSRKGPALSTLDNLSRRAILLGFPIFSLALLGGGVLFAQQHRSGQITPGLLLQPQYLLALSTWLAYAVLLSARAAFGLRGRRAAILTVAGFVTALSALLFYFLRLPWTS